MTSSLRLPQHLPLELTHTWLPMSCSLLCLPSFIRQSLLIRKMLLITCDAKVDTFLESDLVSKRKKNWIMVRLRLTTGGALYLSAVCILPEVLANFYNVPFYFGGTGLLIIVGVCMQTVAQMEGFMLTQRYDGLTGPEKRNKRTSWYLSTKSNKTG